MQITQWYRVMSILCFINPGVTNGQSRILPKRSITRTQKKQCIIYRQKYITSIIQHTTEGKLAQW